jgi:hypothetical protein
MTPANRPLSGLLAPALLIIFAFDAMFLLLENGLHKISDDSVSTPSRASGEEPAPNAELMARLC